MKTSRSKRVAGRPVFLFILTGVLVLSFGWGGVHILAQSGAAASDEQRARTVSKHTVVNSTYEVVSVMVPTWQQSAELARAHVSAQRVDGRPLARVADGYDVGQRVIHDEQSRKTAFPVQLPEDEWRQRLSPEQYRIIRKSGTERAFTSELDKNYEPGIYYSRATGQPLFSSEDKYDSGTGWPSFTKPITPEAVAYFYEASFFFRSVEVVDSLSGAHLGHVFSDGPEPTNQRYCMNGEALVFVPEGGDPPELLLPQAEE